VILTPLVFPLLVYFFNYRYDGLEFGLRSDVTSSTEALFADVRHRGFNEVVRGRILAGNYFLLREHYDEYFLQALRVRRLISRDFEQAFKQVINFLKVFEV